MKAEKLCIFYASKYHLSLVLLEYLKHNNIKKYNVTTFLENGIKDEIEILKQRSKIELAKDINFEETKEIKTIELTENKRKEKCKNKEEQKCKNNNRNKNMIFIIAGKEKYMEEVNNQIKEKINDIDFRNVKIINCYDFEMQRKNMTEILKCNDKILYTTGEEKIELAC